ncbi:MAG: phage tail protein [Candidatus Omnitrophica bacterium]|nr:phage tail protein [Candidatus Omnitrophota bacterium]
MKPAPVKFAGFFLALLIVLIPSVLWADDPPEMEPELVFMPQMGPPRMVPKGSQNYTPPVRDPNNPMDPANMTMGTLSQTNPMNPMNMQMPGTFVFPPGQEPTNGNNFVMMPQYGPIQSPPAQPPAKPVQDPGGASFSEVSGLEVDEGTIDYRTGSEETVLRKIPGVRKHTNVQLKKRDLEQIDKNLFEEVDALHKSIGATPKARDMKDQKVSSAGMQHQNMHDNR